MAGRRGLEKAEEFLLRLGVDFIHVKNVGSLVVLLELGWCSICRLGSSALSLACPVKSFACGSGFGKVRRQSSERAVANAESTARMLRTAKNADRLGLAESTLRVFLITVEPFDFLCSLNIRVIPISTSLHVWDILLLDEAFGKLLFCVKDW